MVKWCKNFLLLTLIGFLASCTQLPPTLTHIEEAEAWFTDQDIDNPVLSSFSTPRVLKGSYDESLATSDSPDVSTAAKNTGGLETQAVISNAKGFIYYIDFDPVRISSPYRIIRHNQVDNTSIIFYGGRRQIQSVAGSSDGNIVVVSMKETIFTGSDFDIFTLSKTSTAVNVSLQTSNTTADIDVSISADASSFAWQGINPVTGVKAVFIHTSGPSILEESLEQIQPSISSNGKFITLVRLLADGSDRVLRYTISSNTYSTIFSSTLSLEHPSISDDGQKVAFLFGGGSYIKLKTVGVSGVSNLVGPIRFNTLEHSHLTRDGRWLTYGVKNSSNISNVFTKHIATGVTQTLTAFSGDQDAFLPYWQMPFPFFEIKRTEVNGRITGSAVAIDGDTMFVGSRVATVGNNNGIGAVFIYQRNATGPESWSLVQTLVSPDLNTGAQGFGASLSVHGNTLIVGEPDRNLGTAISGGAAYIFDKDVSGQWIFTKQLISNDTFETSDRFGFSVDVYEDTAVVSALKADTTKPDSGAIYIFERNQGGTNQWGLLQKRFASDAATDDSFGISVSLYQDTIAVGASNEDNSRGLGAGSVYIFDRNTGGANNWGQVRKRFAVAGVSSEHYGHSVALEGNNLIVGATGAIGKSSGTGAAYLLKRGNNNNWGEFAKFFANDGTFDGDFGNAVAISGSLIVVGAYRDNDQGNDAGSAYVFDLQGFKNEIKLLASDGAAGDNYGVSVAIDGFSVLVGAERFGANEQGQVYLYE